MNGARVLNDEEIYRMMEVATLRDRVLIMTGIHFGTRISEALQLRFGDFRGDTLRIRSKKKSNNQTFPIPEKFKQEVRQLRKYYAKHGIAVDDKTYLFLRMSRNSGNDHGPITPQNANQIINKLAEKIGINDGKVSAHSFRKSFVTRIYEKTGFNIAETQKYSRHKSLASLQYYIRTAETCDLVNDNLWGNRGDQWNDNAHA